MNTPVTPFNGDVDDVPIANSPNVEIPVKVDRTEGCLVRRIDEGPCTGAAGWTIEEFDAAGVFLIGIRQCMRSETECHIRSERSGGGGKDPPIFLVKR
jgi:hypothetical protein